ncbi:sensor histidine kinase [Aridibaculum aurantiacum]|uniref:sensor histidine kinase n=1 Tax=Aridibaculum aurantiacum TaxID=2810307 RepID=UPI001F61E828|nr:HAMP domain-containing sensor histidine kinase [Aridibaculum aurantiacum]
MPLFKNFEWRIGFRVVLLLVTLTAAAFFVVQLYWIYFIMLLPLIVYLVIEFYRFHHKSYEELSQFVESIHYRDFSRNFDVKHAPTELKPLRKGFNEINTTFKIISKEKETQYQYLQKILELVDTGILSYKEEDGAVVWMNETLKRMLQLPYLKTIHSLAKRDETLYQQILALRPGDAKIATAHLERSSFKVLLSSTAFQTEGEKFKLIAFQNIDEALDETESRAWQKLLSVMTHEIMNSIAPISSLADTLKNRLHLSLNKLNNESGSVDDLELGIETIKRRSEGLLKFAETYRNLNKITTLNVQKIYVRDLFENLYQLMQPTLDQKQVEMEIVLKDPGLQLEADTNLVEQVLINLVVNSLDAVKESEQPRITLSGFIAPGGKVIIRVSDNGAGMSEEVMEKIFIPFFSTKKTGSGIGLSLCKQIMMLHKGSIQIQSVEGKGTTFSLHF